MVGIQVVGMIDAADILFVFDNDCAARDECVRLGFVLEGGYDAREEGGLLDGAARPALDFFGV